MNEYPLNRIETWPASDPAGWFIAIKDLWWQSGWGWRAEVFHRGQPGGPDALTPVVRYSLSTGGWSGNEEVIQAMAQNSELWALTWQSSRRGGHYTFELNAENKDDRQHVDEEKARAEEMERVLRHVWDALVKDGIAAGRSPDDPRTKIAGAVLLEIIDVLQRRHSTEERTR